MFSIVLDVDFAKTNQTLFELKAKNDIEKNKLTEASENNATNIANSTATNEDVEEEINEIHNLYFNELNVTKTESIMTILKGILLILKGNYMPIIIIFN